MTSDEKVTYFGVTDSRSKKIKFGIRAKDRTKHIYVIGKTGMGKSTLLENMAIQDIQSGEGLAFIDPHGKTAELLLNYIPENRVKDVLYFAPFDTDFPISFNVMEDVGYDRRHLVVSGLMSTFKKIWVDAWSARMEYILSNTLLALLEYPGATLIGVNKMLSDKAYRKKVVDNIQDPAVKSFWVDEFAKYNERYMQEAGDAIKNKIGQFTANPVIRNIIGQAKSSFDLRKMMDERKIIIINLSKGKVGEQNANLLGSMLITKIYLAAMSRADAPPSVMKNLPNFYLYVDEFQSFANESFADILSEARKYKLNLTIAHQYVEQMSEEVRAAVFGNVGTMIVFRVGAIDSEVFEKEFAPQFTAEDIVNLGLYQMYLRLMIDGVGSQPFSATGMPPIPEPPVTYVPQVIESSRVQFAHPRAQAEEEVRQQTSSTPEEKPQRREVPPTQGPADQRLSRKEGVFTDRREPRKEARPEERPRREQAPRRDVEAPPPDDSGGFQSLKDLKNPSRPERIEKKGITPESKQDLRQALAALAAKEPQKQAAPSPTQSQQKPSQPKSQPQSQPQSRPTPEERSQGNQKQGTAQEGKKEVPEDVLRKILEL